MTVLVQGAGGGVATALIVLASAAGARVWVTSRSADKREQALALGAEQAFESGARLPERVDAVMETVGAGDLPALDPLAAARRQAGDLGRHLGRRTAGRADPRVLPAAVGDRLDDGHPRRARATDPLLRGARHPPRRSTRRCRWPTPAPGSRRCRPARSSARSCSRPERLARGPPPLRRYASSSDADVSPSSLTIQRRDPSTSQRIGPGWAGARYSSSTSNGSRGSAPRQQLLLKRLPVRGVVDVSRRRRTRLRETSTATAAPTATRAAADGAAARSRAAAPVRPESRRSISASVSGNGRPPLRIQVDPQRDRLDVGPRLPGRPMSVRRSAHIRPSPRAERRQLEDARRTAASG